MPPKVRLRADLGWSVTYGDEVLEVLAVPNADDEWNAAGSGRRANGEWPDDGAIRPGSLGYAGSSYGVRVLILARCLGGDRGGDGRRRQYQVGETTP